MILADPSECVESENILPAVHKNFITLEEKGIGGNLLMFLFKDIAHHFISEKPEIKHMVDQVFEKEDDYLKTEKSDFVFGVYQKQL